MRLRMAFVVQHRIDARIGNNLSRMEFIHSEKLLTAPIVRRVDEAVHFSQEYLFPASGASPRSNSGTGFAVLTMTQPASGQGLSRLGLCVVASIHGARGEKS